MTGKSTYGGTGSEYNPSEFAATAKSAKSHRSSRTEKSGGVGDKGPAVRVTQRMKTRESGGAAKSIHSLKSLQSYYSLNEGQQGAASTRGGDTGKCLYDDESDGAEKMADEKSSPLTNGDAVGMKADYPPKPTPPENIKRQKTGKSLDPRPQMPFQSPLGKYKTKQDSPSKSWRGGKSTDRSSDDVKPDALAEALGRVASGSDPERVPKWAKSQGGGGGSKMLPLPRMKPRGGGGDGEDTFLSPQMRRKQPRASFAAPEVNGGSGSPSNPSFQSAREPRGGGKANGLSRGGPVAHSDGFLESTRSNPPFPASRAGGAAAGRLSMMKSLNQTAAAGKQHHTNEASWKIYQQLRVAKE